MAPDVRTDAVLDVTQTVLARPGSAAFSRCRLWFFGGQAQGQRYLMVNDPLPVAGERYLMFLAASPGMPHSTPPDPGVPEMQSTGLADGRWLIRADGTLAPPAGVTPQPWMRESLAGRTVAEAVAAIRAVA